MTGDDRRASDDLRDTSVRRVVALPRRSPAALYENGRSVRVKADRDSFVHGGGGSRNGKLGVTVP